MIKDQIDYKKDYLGLKTLDEAGKLFHYHGEGEHLALTQNIIEDYLVPMLRNETPAPT